ncbi:hypothetical protein [Falsiroseomonas sp. HW251]|uniref:hypothetical protein n=1 Tax=Falsiroseomonas sp. HW251 TaxID=3390998 RepID=UPI003D31CD36
MGEVVPVIVVSNMASTSSDPTEPEPATAPACFKARTGQRCRPGHLLLWSEAIIKRRLEAVTGSTELAGIARLTVPLLLATITYNGGSLIALGRRAAVIE